MCLCYASPAWRREQPGQYKSCVFASLRTRLTMDWSTYHVVAQSSLWEDVERIPVKTLKPIRVGSGA